MYRRGKQKGSLFPPDAESRPNRRRFVRFFNYGGMDVRTRVCSDLTTHIVGTAVGR